MSGELALGIRREKYLAGHCQHIPFNILHRYLPFALLMLVAVIVRSPAYGNPDVGLDEQFYLVVADRMMHSALPYVDIWDRKPIGLFLIYAATRLLGGDGFVQYQIVASLFSGATAGIIWLIARRSSNDLAGMAVGIAYLFWLNIYAGSAGQSPVFYNLPVALAFALAFRANELHDPKKIARWGAIAMALCGLAIQIKYTVVAEGAFLGLWFLWRLWTIGKNPLSITTTAIVYALLGLAPTLAVTCYYAAIGHFPEFAYANFWSIFDRGRLDEGSLARAKSFLIFTSIPLQIFLPFALLQRWMRDRRIGDQKQFWLMAGWLIAAFCGFVMIGNFYDHYFLPMLPPIFICIAPLLKRPVVGLPLGAFLIIWAIVGTGYPDFASNAAKHDAVSELTASVRPYVEKDCLFVFDGPSALYMTTHACAPTRFVYPDHLSNDVEKNAIGTDARQEMMRVLNSKPGAIVTASKPIVSHLNAANLSLLRHALTHDYRLVAAVSHPLRIYYVYARKDLAHGGIIGPAVPYAN